MEALETIMSRRSVRHYTDEPVDEATIETLLRAAMQAPSAVNKQPWHFVVISDREKLQSIQQEHPYAAMLGEATVAIAVCGDLKQQNDDNYWIADCSAATENLLLAAHASGLGAVWLGIYPREERMEMLSRQLELPEHVRPLALVALGWPAEHPEPVDRYQPERIHRDRYGRHPERPEKSL